MFFHWTKFYKDRVWWGRKNIIDGDKDETMKTVQTHKTFNLFSNEKYEI